MKLNLFKRSMIFATFFGSCLCIALIVASLGTTHWIDARARRTSNPEESEGRISFGLFEGHKELNYGLARGGAGLRRWRLRARCVGLSCSGKMLAEAFARRKLASSAFHRVSDRRLADGVLVTTAAQCDV
ncbi:Clarin-3 [Operophtera brumata]|uniref:Clarin-3 n=1 Tax=Operophtera brumata TaxID=104452 RepID=A0A0L7KPS4_OPEBR|nr:Clarin-3 [Operophtera brumata]